jgi:hypothetical protein
MAATNSIATPMDSRNALGVNSAHGHAPQMQSMSKAPITAMSNGIHQASDTARSIRSITYDVSFAGYALKRAQPAH